MESFLIGSFHKPPSSLPFPATAEVFSLPTGSRVAAQNCNCKALNNPENNYAMAMRLQFHRQLATHKNVRSNDERIVLSSPRRTSKYLVNATSENSHESEPSKSHWRSIQHALDAFYRFSRPHTVIGTALSIMSVSLLAVEKLSDFSPLFFTGVLEAIAAALLMNIYIVGLNQLSDIEVDKVNKPHLPLASGEYSVTMAVMIVSSFAFFSLGWMVGSWPLFWALFISFVLGTAYSINVSSFFYRYQFYSSCHWTENFITMHVYGRPAVFSKSLIFATAFMSFFSVVVALFKDIPDIVGDKIFGIRSFTVRLGQQRVFWICISLLEMAYLVALSVGVTSSCIWSKWITVIGHIVLASLLWNRANSIDLKNKNAITSFYMFIWKLFYAEYLIIPLVR
ncbi:homogentisate phytyltransferase 1, chloroplastic [Olea europaea subsp. europaea]|uniref:Homogentisate phytyltransferase 1, chloroplastic n=1 Tax=Olea europaea subsp. europaea TaxID=158383 RepID=A0A8S0SHH8_OLEEU|nr:homogentisate phytyltransferase 1, chloroplastic [Olea europaea subsp. europaea]